MAAWHVLADALRLDGVRLVPPGDGTPPLPGLHPTRSAHLMARAGSLDEVTIGSVGEIDPAVAARFDLTRTSGGGTVARRIGWLEVDLGLLFDEEQVPRRITVGGAVSRFPSSDIDLAFVVEDRHPADAVAEALRAAGGDLLGVRAPVRRLPRARASTTGARSLAYRLRFCARRPHADRRRGGWAAHALHRRRGRTEFGAVLRWHRRRPPWQGGPVEVRLVDPSDDNELAEWTAVLRASDEDLWPDLTGFTLPDIRAFARYRSRVEALRSPGGAGTPAGRSSAWG